jgi:predicted nucleic acid-binding protein
MIFVIDSNILISALIRDSITRKILIESGWKFYYPEIAFEEIRRHSGAVLQKSGMDEEDYGNVLNILLKHIILVPEEQFKVNIKEANKIIGKIDATDVVFLALAMGINNSKIWSNDAHLHMQNKVKSLKTEEVVKLFE